VTIDGRVLWLRNLVTVIVENGQPTKLRGVSIDITERKQAEEAIRTLNTELEQRVTERTAELQWTIAELQQLTRFAAHDLQEPVRIVTSYVYLLAARYRGKLDEEADKFIQYTVDGMKRLQRLLLDLLAYSEASTQRLEYTAVDGEALVAGALADLRGSIVDRGAVITHDPLPVVWGDETQLRIVFRNLISNGIKFHNGSPPWVYIAATQKNSLWVFSVQDNGVGVEPQDSERIFLIFQRRHAKEPYPKPGVGLAICKKIIERHGGRIWVESTFGKGATFYFTLPVKSP
jgi:light-regulated signal transduction histidine kinase (bacteriophytochrome)